MEIWWDKQYPNVLRAHFLNEASDFDTNAMVDNVILQVMSEDRDVNLIITKDYEFLTSDYLNRLIGSIRLCLIQSNLKKFTIVHPEAVTIPFGCEAEIMKKWKFYKSLDEAYNFLGKI